MRRQIAQIADGSEWVVRRNSLVFAVDDLRVLPIFIKTRSNESAITEMLDGIGKVIVKTVFNVGYAGESG
jgi:hypothetical protein